MAGNGWSYPDPMELIGLARHGLPLGRSVLHFHSEKMRKIFRTASFLGYAATFGCLGGFWPRPTALLTEVHGLQQAGDRHGQARIDVSR